MREQEQQDGDEVEMTFSAIWIASGGQDWGFQIAIITSTNFLYWDALGKK